MQDGLWFLLYCQVDFQVHLRNTGSSLAYNGGLVIGFASPFIIMEFFLNLKYEFIIFIPMILGAIAMVIGSTRFLLNRT